MRSKTKIIRLASIFVHWLHRFKRYVTLFFIFNFLDGLHELSNGSIADVFVFRLGTESESQVSRHSQVHISESSLVVGGLQTHTIRNPFPKPEAEITDSVMAVHADYVNNDARARELSGEIAFPFSGGVSWRSTPNADDVMFLNPDECNILRGSGIGVLFILAHTLWYHFSVQSDISLI